MNSRDFENQVPAPSQYTDEVLYANWNPLARLLAEPLAHAKNAVFDSAEVEAFLARLYVCQQFS